MIGIVAAAERLRALVVADHRKHGEVQDAEYYAGLPVEDFIRESIVDAADAWPLPPEPRPGEQGSLF